MNIPVNHPLGIPDQPTALRGKALEDATLVALAPSVSAAYFNRQAASGPRERLIARQDGALIPKPYIAGAFELRSGGTRHVLLMARGIDQVLSKPLELFVNDQAAATVDPGWLQPPVSDLAGLIEGLTESGRLKLLRMLLTTGASLFLSVAGSGLIDSFRELMEICDLTPIEPVAATGFGGQTVLSYPAPGCGNLAGQADVVVLAQERPALLRKVAIAQEAGGNLLHIHLPPGVQDCEVVLFGDLPLRLAPQPAQMRRLPAPVWIDGRTPQARDWLLERIVAAAPKDPGAANALRELRPGAVEASLLVRHLSATRDGVLHLFELADPEGLVRAVIVERGTQRTELPALCGVDGRGVIAGLAELDGRGGGAELYRILLMHHSGRLREVARGMLDPFDGNLPADFEAAWRDSADRPGLERALAMASLGAIRRPMRSARRRFGAAPAAPVLRIVTEIGDSVDIIRARAAMIFAERGAQRVEVVCTLVEGPQAAAARRAVEEVVAVYGIAHVLVSVPEDSTPAERVQAALAEGSGPALILHEAVLPAQPGWLPAWQRRLAHAKDDVVGAALLAADGSVAATASGPGDAWRGLPAARLPEWLRAVRRPVCACFGLTEAGIARLFRLPAGHPDPAVLIARLVSRDGLQIATRHPFVRYASGISETPLQRAILHGALARIEEEQA